MVSDPALGTDEAIPSMSKWRLTALAIEAIAPDGYNAIKIIVGIEQDGTVLGSRVLSHQETPGLGDKIDLRVTDWILSFAGRKLRQKRSRLEST